MTNKFSSFLTQKGRWLTATLFLLFSLGIGNMWGACDPGTIFKVVGKDGLTNGDIAKGDAIDLSSYVTVNAGTITAYGKNDGSLAVIDQKAINIVKYADAYFTCTLPTGCSLQEGDVIKYIIYNKNAYLQPATDSDNEDKLTLTKTSNVTTEGKVVIPAGHELIGKSTFYLYGSANATKVRSLEIVRPYTITLDATTNGGTAVSPVKGLSGDKVVLTHAFKKDNEPLKYYKFKGWYENESGGDPVSNLYTVTGGKTLYAQFEDLPTGGTMFSLQMESSLRPASTVGLASGKTLDLLTYATISGGAAILENTTSNNDKGRITTSGEISFNDNGALVTITLDFPLQAGDEIEHVGNNYQLCYTKTKTYATTFSSTAKKYTVTDAADGLKGATTLYVWRAASSETKVTKITITRPTPHTLSYAVSPAGKGTVTLGATSLVEGAQTTATYSAIDGAYEFDEWQISGATISSASTNPTTVTMGSTDATITLKLKAAVTKYTVTTQTSTGTDSYGTVSAEDDELAEDGTTTITATPAAGYQVTNWAVEGTDASISPNGASNSNTTTLTMGTANATVTVTFGQIDYTVSKTLTNCAVKDGSAAIPATMNYGDDLSTIIVPTTGNLLPSSITVTGVTSYTWNASTGALTLTDVTGNVSISIEAAAPQTGSGTITYALVTSGETAATYSAGTFTGILSGGTPSLNTLGASNTLTGGNGVGVQSDKNTPKSSRTAGITSSTADFNAASSPYAEFTFSVLDGYTFTPTAISVPVLAISNNAYFTAIVTDGSSTWTSTTAECTQGAQAYINAAPSGGSALTGTVNIRVFCHNQATAAKGFRFGTGSVTITGTVVAAGACTPPTIAWDGDQPEDAFVSDGSKTFKVTSNYTDGVALELSENTCGATIAAKSGSDNKQWVVYFTGAGSVKVTPKVVGDGSTICADPVSATAKTLTVTQAYDVTFNKNGHGADIAKQVVADGGKATAPYVADVADWVFGGWFTDAECTAGNEFDFANTTITADRPLYAKWTADACASERKSLSKVVLTSASEGTVSGHNGDEYAGAAVIAGLNGTQDADLGGGSVTGYKLSGGGSGIVFATLKKGSLQAGDKVVIGITKKQDTRELNGTKNLISIYYGTNASDAALLTTIYNVSAAGYYTYRLTEADVTAIGEKKGIGVFRESSNGQNPYIYSVEITGCRSFAISHDVTFDMKGHGTQVTKQTIEVGAKVTEPAEPEAAGFIFGGWYKETTLENTWNFATDVMSDNNITLYAKWTEDPCTDRQSLSKVVLTAKDNGTVTGYNSKEYAGEAIIASLDKSEDADIIGDETKERGYKLNSGGNSIVMATLKKGNFQEGDKVIVGITKVNDQRTVDASTEIMTIYAGSDKDHMMEVATIKNVNAAGFYTYRLTAANATAINEAGYKSIGLFRASSNGQNHYVYSVEITGCRDWAELHSVSYNLMGHGTPIAPQEVAKGDKVTKPTNPVETDWAFCGWYKEEGLVNEWNFASDVMGSSNITLYAKWESEVGAIKLFDGEGNLNTTNFISPAKTTIEISSVTYPCLAEFSSNRTSLGGATPTDMVQYNATTNQAKIKMTFYNNNSGVKKAILYKYEEGADAPVKIEIEVPGQEIYTTDYYEFNSSKNRSFYVCMNDRSNIRVLQVTVMDNGTTIQKAGQAGYSVTFNKGRMYVKNGVETAFEGMTINASSEYKVYNNSNLATSSYISFTNAVANTVFRVTKSSSNAYYITNDLGNKGASYTTDKEVTLTTTGTWYIGAVSGGSAASFTKFEFIAPKCEAPAFNALANSNICSGDPYVALDGTGAVTDGGTITYKWYAEGGTDVLGTDATYTPTADGSYYVKALHHVDGYTDNEATSDVVTVTTHAGTVITEPLVDLRGAKDAVVTLTVTATGKNLSYAWKESATIDGTYTDVAGAADDNELNVTITEGMDKYYKVVVHSDCGADQESVAHVTQFVPVSQQDVTASIVWDWSEAASGNTDEMKTNTTPVRDTEFIMANGDARIYNNANFWSDKLVISGQYAVRGGNYFQGGLVKFHTTVPGVVRVEFSHTGTATADKPARELFINGVGTGATTANTTRVTTAFIDVPAGDVSITAQYIDPTKPGNQYVRVYKVEFYALAHQRTTGYNTGDLGTVCLEDATFFEGANLYELAGLNENGYLAFDEITTGNLEAGKPYLFEVTNPSKISFYKPVGAAHSDSEIENKGMIGTFNGTTLYQGADNLYYFSGRHIWKVNDFTVAIPIPAHRCYIDYDVLKNAQASPNPAPGRRRVTLGVQGTQVATDLGNVEGNNVQPVKMMINGQLFILRGEKLYDATGRLVK